MSECLGYGAGDSYTPHRVGRARPFVTFRVTIASRHSARGSFGDLTDSTSTDPAELPHDEGHSGQYCNQLADQHVSREMDAEDDPRKADNEGKRDDCRIK